MVMKQEELQAQFKRAQEAETKHKLSERNRVEIIMKLLEKKELNIFYTLNGREYITPQQSEKEIKRGNR